MTSWQFVRVFAGLMILISLALGVPDSPAFVTTGWCPLEIVLRKLGVRNGA